MLVLSYTPRELFCGFLIEHKREVYTVETMKDFYEKHLLFCTQVKAPEKKCCSQASAVTMAGYAKSRLKELDMHGPGKIRVSQSGCLGRCSDGPNLLIYPEGIWYTYQNQADIDEIIDSHLLKGILVERLLN